MAGDERSWRPRPMWLLLAVVVAGLYAGGIWVGAAAAVERLNRFGIPGPAATASAALTGPVSLTTIAALGAVGIVIAVATDELPGAALAAAVAAVVVLLAVVAGVVAALRSPRVGDRLMTLLIGFGVAQTLTAIPSTPGAVGIFESGMVGVFTLLGIPLGLATTIAITYRVLETWLPTLAGVPVVVRPRGS